MPYDPHAHTEADRSRSYWLIWFGAAGALLLAIDLFAGLDPLITALARGAASAGLLISAMPARTDSYFQSLCSVGHRWAVAAVGAYMIVLFFLDITDVAYGAGYRLASGVALSESTADQSILTDGWITLLGVSIVFYAGYAYAWARDRFGRAE